MKKISVILPCYNVEPYVDRCFESLVRQTIGMDNMELIFINDASTDRTWDKLIGFEKQYPDSVTVIHLEVNSRQGTARNIGLSYATAPFVGYVDADDWIEPDMFDRMVTAIEQYHCDFVECRWDFARDENSRKEPVKVGEDGYMDLSDLGIRTGFVGTRISLVMSCDKVFRRSFLLDNAIFYPEGLRHEDFFFSYMVFLYAKSCYCMEEVFYHYYINPHSTVRQKGQEYHFDQMTVMEAFLGVCEERGLRKQYGEIVDWMFLEQYYVYMLWKVFEQFPERAYMVYLEMKAIILKYVPNYKNNSYRNWECNQFDNVMLKLLDYNLSKDQFEKMRMQFMNTIKPEDAQQF